MGPKSQHFVGMEVYIGETTDRLDTWIVYGEFMSDGRPASMCFPFYSFDGRISECKWEMRHKDAPPLKVAMLCNPLNQVYFSLLDIDWPDYCFQFKKADDWTPIAGIYTTHTTVTTITILLTIFKIRTECAGTGVSSQVIRLKDFHMSQLEGGCGAHKFPIPILVHLKSRLYPNS